MGRHQYFLIIYRYNHLIWIPVRNHTMKYQVLARKWRPHRFEDMVGQEHVLRALTNALDKNRLHHAYMFTGTRGVGKTTIARIFAKSLNCEKGVSSTPCGECSTCVDIDEGRFFDLIEVDAASRTKVDQTRELLENVPYAPTSGRYKVYLIDEVHMFSDHSFNALLKTLEEPPEHVKFLLATTDPQKVPVTVLSRCLQFSLKRLPERQIHDYLNDLMQRENCEVEDSAMAHIARAADGSMRDSLSLLDQAIAFGEGKVLASEVEAMLGRPSPDRVLDLVAALGEGDAPKAMEMVSVFAEYSPDFASLLGDVLTVLHQIALLQTVPGTQAAVSFDARRMTELSQQLSPEDVHLFYQIGLLGRRDISLAPDMCEGFEMTMLRMLAFRPVDGAAVIASSATRPAPAAPKMPVAAIAPTDVIANAQVVVAPEVKAEAPDNSEVTDASPAEASEAGGSSRSAQLAALKAKLTDDARGGSLKKKTVKNPVEAPAVVTTLVSPPPVVQSQPASASVQASQEDSTAKPRYTEVAMDGPPDYPAESYPESVAPQGSPAEAIQTPVTPPVVEEKVALDVTPVQEGLSEQWHDMLGKMAMTGMQQELANNCILQSIDGNRITLVLQKRFEGLMQVSSTRQLETALKTLMGENASVDIQVKSGNLETPARLREKAEQLRLQSARDSIAQDPLVQRLCQALDGTVQEGSIRPVVEPPAEQT